MLAVCAGLTVLLVGGTRMITEPNAACTLCKREFYLPDPRGIKNTPEAFNHVSRCPHCGQDAHLQLFWDEINDVRKGRANPRGLP